MVRFYSTTRFPSNFEQKTPSVVEDDDIRTGETCAPIKITSVKSEIGTAQPHF